MSSVTITEARASLAQLVDRVAAGEEITITRHGLPVAVLVRPDTLHVRRISPDVEAMADMIGDLIDNGRREPLRPLQSTLTSEDADRWVEELHADRQRR